MIYMQKKLAQACFFQYYLIRYFCVICLLNFHPIQFKIKSFTHLKIFLIFTHVHMKVTGNSVPSIIGRYSKFE